MGKEAGLITFEEARAIAAEQLADEYPAEANFVVAPWGFETDEVYIVLAGPHDLVYGILSEEAMKWMKPAASRTTCVNKHTGELTIELEAPDGYTPCGVDPRDDEDD